ncbi:hypothetical protein CHS0354_027380 [Potamilus streckersoni]|uniref:Uncharacterized protein n=1 Tax=Potamilus streckersoni TaxID=2493646 RepID=A0AAE0SR19_9BIVA|nr:hypothetical protein CHS0354_027380 [Potamilus streckersoni]
MLEIFAGALAIMMVLFVIMNITGSSLSTQQAGETDEKEYKISWETGTEGYVIVAYPSKLWIIEKQQTVSREDICKPGEANKDVREKEAESLRDVGVMMSRNIAAQVTTNALPTNPAAFLHDYYSSPLDINPDEAVMPIIEIHEDFVRFYYSGKTVAYEELFRQDNGLDNYLNRLSPAQSKFIRMDIYAIRPYYIVMSVLKEHGIEIRHWHLLGYNDNDKTKPTADPYQGDPSEPKKISAEDASSDRQKPTDSDPDGGNGKNRDSQRPPSMSAPAVPEDLLADNLSGIPGNGKNGGSGKDRESPSDNNNEGEPELTEEEAETLLKYLTELRRLMPEGSIPDFNAPPGKPDIEALKEFLKRLMQNARPQDEPLFRIPDDNALQMPLINPHAPAETHIPDPINSVTALLHYMYLKQTAYDSGVMQDISMNEFISYLGILESNPGMAEELPFYPLALNITSTLLYKAKTDNTADRQKLPLRNAPGATGYFPNELKLNKNNFPGAQDSALLTDEQQTVSVLKTVSAPVETEITVRRYPTAYKGEK